MINSPNLLWSVPLSRQTDRQTALRRLLAAFPTCNLRCLVRYVGVDQQVATNRPAWRSPRFGCPRCTTRSPAPKARSTVQLGSTLPPRWEERQRCCRLRSAGGHLQRRLSACSIWRSSGSAHQRQFLPSRISSQQDRALSWHWRNPFPSSRLRTHLRRRRRRPSRPVAVSQPAR